MLAGTAGAAPLYIDAFGTSDIFQIFGGAPNPVYNSSLVAAPDTLWGDRYTELTRTSGSGSSLYEVNLGTPGFMSYNNALGVSGDVRLYWGILNSIEVNLTPNGGSTFLIQGTANKDVPLTLSVMDSSFNSSAVTMTLPSGTSLLAIPSFLLQGSADLTKVVSAELLIDGKSLDNVGVSLDYVAVNVVPEPATMLLIGGGLLLLGSLRRRSKKA
jgi:hypothetical protein